MESIILVAALIAAIPVSTIVISIKRAFQW